MKMVLVVVIASLGLFSSAYAAGNAQEGKKLFDTKCKMCHGPEGKGNPAIAKMMKVQMKELGSKEVQAKTDAEIKKIIVGGTGKMIPVKGLSDAQIDDVIAFVRTLGKK